MKFMHLLKFALVFSLLTFIAAQKSHATNVIVGNCNQVTENIQAAEGATIIIENDCFANDPAESFRVRYFWLDSLSMSFLMAGYSDDNLKDIAGQNPQMWRGGIYPVLREILDEFGERPVAGSKWIYPVYSTRMLSRDG
ncbi:MAG: hypothetical protein AAF412_11985, partial [Pseudomonadota bacterium]